MIFEFEPKELVIVYDRGKMCINVDVFMQKSNIAQIRKLVKIIQKSYTPEGVDVITRYCRSFLTECEREQRKLANVIVHNRTVAKELDPEIEKMMRFRNRQTKNSNPYKYYVNVVKEYKKKKSDALWYARHYQTEFNQNKRLKTKYERVLELMR